MSQKLNRKVSWQSLFTSTLILLAGGGCTTLPTPEMTKYEFPSTDVYVTEIPKRKFIKLGQVRTRVNFSSMIPDREFPELCANYYNRAAANLLKRAKREAKADAVIDVRAVTFYLDGTSKLDQAPECSDDGGEGQILLQGIAIRWEPEPTSSSQPKQK